MTKKIINLHEKNEFKERLAKTREYLAEVESGLHAEMVELALAGKWNDWSESQEEGTVFTFTDEMLINTGDKNIEALFSLMHEVIHAQKNIENK